MAFMVEAHISSREEPLRVWLMCEEEKGYLQFSIQESLRVWSVHESEWGGGTLQQYTY